MRAPYDRGSKWLIEHHGDALLRLGGVAGIASWKPLQAELVQPRQLPDGLLEVTVTGQAEPLLFLVEVGTYPERRLLEQVVRNQVLVFLDRRELPEVLTVILQPKGQYRLASPHELASRLGWSRLQFSWRVVELWTLAAADLLTANDVGLIPWVPLTQFEEPPEVMLRQCRQRIDEQAAPAEHANLLAVTQVLTRLRYNEAGLLAILGGKKIMIESPLIQELVAERTHKDILLVLTARFGLLPQEIVASLQAVQEEKKLEELVDWAARCADMEAFRSRLIS